MLKCPYCENTANNKAGLSMHVKYVHPGRWRGTLVGSLPPGFKLGKEATKASGAKVPAVARKGQKKKPIKSDCPWCDYTTGHPPALARHVQAAHPERWRGTLRRSVGVTVEAPEPVRAGRKPMEGLPPAEMRRLKKRREYGAMLRKRYRAQGLTSVGQPRKRMGRRPLALRGIPDVVEARTVKREMPILGNIERCPNCGEPQKPYQLAKGIINREKLRMLREEISVLESYETENHEK